MADVAVPSAAPGTSSDIGKKMAHAPAGATEHGPQMRECVEECRNCEQACLETIPHCLSKGGHHARPDHIMLLMNCASMCATSARFLIAGSNLHTHTCAACKQVCEACADDCEGIMAADAGGGGGGGDKCMQRCAEACRSCARTCGEMLGAARCT